MSMSGMTEMPSIPTAGSIAIADLTGDAVVRVPAGATVAEVAKVIADKQVGAVVVGDDARPTALVTERDVVKVVASGRIPPRRGPPTWPARTCCGVRRTRPSTRRRSG